MKTIRKGIIFLAVAITSGFASCGDYLDPAQLSIIEEKDLYRNLNYIQQLWVNCYSYLPNGYSSVLWTASDEAEAVDEQADGQKFNLGNWTKYDMPDNMWHHYYKGIKQCCEIMENLQDVTWEEYKDSNPTEYERRNALMKEYITEARFLRAYYYFELVKRYGGVPLVTRRIYLNDGDDLYFVKTVKRNTFEECVNFIVSECNALIPQMEETFDATWKGRATAGAAMALKSRVLLYAASDLYNQPGNTNPLIGYTSGEQMQRWLDAAMAASDIINLNQYRLHNSYRDLFILKSNDTSNEIIWSRQVPNVNNLEKENYPIGYDGGNTGACPTGDLVDAYEMSNGTLFSWDNPATAVNPYEDRDSRLKATILVNNERWSNRPVEIWEGGLDGKPRRNATKTGYYLKKHLIDGLNIQNDYKASRQWIYFRYAEILLNYAEAVNRYAGPAFKPAGAKYTPKEAVNLVRTRALQPVTDISFSRRGDLLNRETFNEFVMNERRIELAFEDHRWWDIRRSMIAPKTIGGNVTGVRVNKTEAGGFSYSPFTVEKRLFEESKMYFYPIPQSEIIKSNGNLQQNPNW